MPATNSPICGYIMGSPPQMETMGAPHSSTAARHSSSGTRCEIVDSYSRMRPQPVQVRLQACRGSSIMTSGKRLLIMGCGLRSPDAPVSDLNAGIWAWTILKGFEESGAAELFFCHSGFGRIIFFAIYAAI